MSDINFIPGGDEVEQKNKPVGEDQPTVKWTNPGEMESKTPSAGKKKVEDIFADTETAPMQVAPTDAEPTMPAKPNILGLFSMVKDSLFKKGSPAPNNGQFKKSKEELNNYRVALAEESEKRKNVVIPPIEKKEKTHDKSSFTKRDLWQAPNVIKTNLIQSEDSGALDWNENINKLLLAVVSACLLLVLAYLGLEIKSTLALQKNQVTNQSIQEIKTQIQAFKKGLGDIETFQKKLEVASGLLKKHVYWTNFFKFWEDNLFKEVYFSGDFSGETNGEYTFSALTDSYANAANQIKALRAATGPKNSRIFADLVVGKASYGAEKAAANDEPATASNPKATVTFDLQVKMDPSIFYYQEKN
jgi:hypothetical protein